MYKNCKFLMNFHDNSKNKNRKIDFSFGSSHCESLIKTGAKLREEGLYIHSWEKPSYGNIKYRPPIPVRYFVRVFVHVSDSYLLYYSKDRKISRRWNNMCYRTFRLVVKLAVNNTCYWLKWIAWSILANSRCYLLQV